MGNPTMSPYLTGIWNPMGTGAQSADYNLAPLSSILQQQQQQPMTIGARIGVPMGGDTRAVTAPAPGTVQNPAYNPAAQGPVFPNPAFQRPMGGVMWS
jgi:hypothetical protein